MRIDERLSGVVPRGQLRESRLPHGADYRVTIRPPVPGRVRARWSGAFARPQPRRPSAPFRPTAPGWQTRRAARARPCHRSRVLKVDTRLQSELDDARADARAFRFADAVEEGVRRLGHFAERGRRS